MSFSDGAYFRDNEMDVFFGGVAGFSYFNPEEMRLRNFEPEIRLAGLRINNKELNVYDRVKTNVLNLTYNEAHVSLTFCVGDLINNENCVFAYRIADFSDAWIYNGSNPTVSITRLPPGRYQLEVRYTNGDRVWSKSTSHVRTACGASMVVQRVGYFRLFRVCRHLSQLSSIQSFATESG